MRSIASIDPPNSLLAIDRLTQRQLSAHPPTALTGITLHVSMIASPPNALASAGPPRCLLE